MAATIVALSLVVRFSKLPIDVLTPLSDAEITAYVKHSKKTYPNRKIEQLSIQVDGDFVDLRCQFAPENFERIRRITVYLVGTLDRFNDAKRAEVQDRVKHL